MLNIIDNTKQEHIYLNENELVNGHIYRELNFGGKLCIGFRYDNIRAIAIDGNTVYSGSDDSTSCRFIEVNATLTVHN